MDHADLGNGRFFPSGCPYVPGRGGGSLIEGITVVKLLILAAIVLGLYLSLLIIYGIGAGSFYRKKHIRAKQRMKRYMRDLSRLEKMNLKKEIHRS